MSRKTSKTPKAAQLAEPPAPSSIDLVSALLSSGDGADLGGLLPLATRQLPVMLAAPATIEGPFSACAVQEAASALIEARGDAGWREVVGRVEAHMLAGSGHLNDTDVSRYAYSVAEGSFALGLVLGMRLVGAR